MSRARDDRRRNMRKAYADEWCSVTYGEADGCYFTLDSLGNIASFGFAETHEPGSHELEARFAPVGAA